MNRSRFAELIACAVLVLSLLTGCYDSREIDETGYMIALGVDKGQAEGRLRYTFQFSNPLAVGGGEEEPSGGKGSGGEEQEGAVWDSGNPMVKNVVVEASDYYIALNLLHHFMSKRPNLSHIKLIVFSADTARDGLLEQSRLLMQEREVRPNTNIAVARGTAEAFLKSVNPKLEESTAKYYELLTEDEAMAYAPMVELREFVDAVSGRARSPVLPLAGVSGLWNQPEPDGAAASDPGRGNDLFGGVTFSAGEIPRRSDVRSELMGMAVFRNEKMVGEMNGEEALLYQLLCGEVETAFLSVPSPEEGGRRITLQIWMNRKPRSRVEWKKEVPQIRINAEINANLVGARIEDFSQGYDELERYTAGLLAAELTGFLERTSREYGADILGFGNAAKRRCLTWQQWEQLNWEERYAGAEFDLAVQLQIRRGGTTLPLTME